MKNITKLTFKRFIMTIGNLPSSYVDSLSYYECLVWLCNYLEKTVIPTVNNNGEAVEELQEKYVELKNYVDTYFENLDVQEEINNKLDEMADSGQLADIIAQYIELAGVLAYNTKAELKSATNIVNGSICRTLGTTTYNDGLGAYYKIRPITSGDVVDDDNILALTISDTLIAEKISDYYINNLNERIEKTENQISNQKYGILFAGRDMNDFDSYLGRTSFYWSNDGVNLYKIGTSKDFKFDSHCLFHFGNYYYCFGDNQYYYSTDLKNWTHSGTKVIYPHDTVWGDVPFYDESTQTLYIYDSFIYNVENDTNYFKITYKTATQNEDGTLNFSDNYEELLYVSGHSYCDGYMYYDNVKGYVFAVANRDDKTIEVYHANSPTELGSMIIKTRQYQVEAPQLCGDKNGNIVMYCDFNDLQTIFGNDWQNVDGRFILSNSSLHSSTFPTSNYYWNADIVKTSNGYARHLSPLVCDEDTFQLIKEIGIFPSKTYCSYVKGNGIITDSTFLSISNISTDSSNYTKILLYDYIKPILITDDTSTHYVRFYTWFNHANSISFDIKQAGGKIRYMANSELRSPCRDKTITGSNLPRYYTQYIGSIDSSYPTDYVSLPFDR